MKYIKIEHHRSDFTTQTKGIINLIVYLLFFFVCVCVFSSPRYQVINISEGILTFVERNDTHCVT